MRENTMKQLGIVLLVVGIVVGFYSQSVTGVFAQTTSTPTGRCHWWDPFCHRNSTPPGYGSGSGYGQCNSGYQNCADCNGAQICCQGSYGCSGNYGSCNQYSQCYSGQCGAYGYYYCQAPSTPGYGSSPCPGYPYCNTSPSYYPAQQESFVSVTGIVTSASTLEETGESCVINLVGAYQAYQYIGQTVTVTGVETGSCPYAQLTVDTLTPISTGVPVVQSQLTTTTATTTVTQSTTSTPLVTQPTTDYTPYVLLGIFALLIIGVLSFVYVRTHPQPLPAQLQPETVKFCLKCGTQLQGMKFCGNCGASAQ